MNMNFGIINSSTFLYTPDNENIDHSLVTYFLYDRDISIGDRNPYGQDYTAEQIIKDIQWLRPVGFSGTGLFGSHTWVLYGYYKGTDQYTQFKMNMGWPNAANNGWYSLDDVPEYLNDDQQYLYNIAPRDVVKFVGNTVTGDCSPSEPYKNIEEAVTNVSNGTTLIFKAGSDNLFSEPLTITKPLTLKGRNVIIRK